MEIPQDKALEFMQVSGLLALDLDILLDISKQKNMTLEKLRAQIAHTHKMKEDVINDPKARKMRYEACSFLFSLSGKTAASPKMSPTTEIPECAVPYPIEKKG